MPHHEDDDLSADAVEQNRAEKRARAGVPERMTDAQIVARILEWINDDDMDSHGLGEGVLTLLCRERPEAT